MGKTEVKKKQISGVFTLPKWMVGIKAKEPEGNYTPDQISNLMEINLLLNDSNPDCLRECVSGLVTKVPLKNQQMLKTILSISDDQVLLTKVNEFIDKVNAVLVQFQKDVLDHAEPSKEELPAGGLEVEPSGDSSNAGSAYSGDWEDSSDFRRKPSSRGVRALRSAKRQSS